ncbi:hypothetical protein DESUT3_27250 [Desulfuromonas versatilis]|uniref:SbsA Ig-like domain-containing protein n=1 Tax=Desulfuromonas versatilis TaxID=2802975 RepID=A0ABN6DZS9_9BACT|nr:hypothetical protein [Desulfuromonas versatilis]BCR05656.1 hypothetical protein DESUT3_27250 [Desulfuromonas versatilis]
MNRLFRYSFSALVAALLAAGCGGGGGSSNTTAAPTTPPPGALQPGGSGADLGQVADDQGNAVTVDFSNALDINDNNQVVGFAAATAGASFKAALWAVDAQGAATVTPTSLAALAGNTFSAAFSVANSGDAVGQSAKGAQLVAVIWKDGAAGPEELPALSAAGNSAAFGISPDGSGIVGEAFDATTGTTRAVIWRVAADGAIAAPQVLPTNIFVKLTADGSLPVAFSSALRISDAGVIVGEVEDGEGVLHAAVWEPGAGSAYTPFDLRNGGEEGSSALAINGAGLVIGESETSGGEFVPVYWSKDATGEYKRTELAAAGGAGGVNSAGRIAGWETSAAVDNAVVWNAPSLAKATLFTSSSQAYAINDNNLVVGRKGSVGFIKLVE